MDVDWSRGVSLAKLQVKEKWLPSGELTSFELAFMVTLVG
jgi:hypothetical protein